MTVSRKILFVGIGIFTVVTAVVLVASLVPRFMLEPPPPPPPSTRTNTTSNLTELVYNPTTDKQPLLRNVSTAPSVSLIPADLVLTWEKGPNWQIVDTLFGRPNCQLSPSKEELVVLYPAGSYSPQGSIRGGFQFYAQPAPFPNTQITFNYSVFFPQSFDFVKGGKLPGIWIGDVGANGGNHITTGASMRVMWRENGTAEAYVYTMAPQNETYYQLPGFHQNGQAGESIWRGSFQFNTGVWNTISMKVTLNTQGNMDGIMQLTINQVTMSYSQMRWQVRGEKINGLMMQTFFGGEDVSWATPIDQTASFRNFIVSQV
jgi:hypothetical protein